MLQRLTAKYTDGSTGIVEFEKPPGAHPQSVMAYRAGLIAAERLGRTVDQMSRSVTIKRRDMPPAIIEVDVMSREEILNAGR